MSTKRNAIYTVAQKKFPPFNCLYNIHMKMKQLQIK